VQWSHQAGTELVESMLLDVHAASSQMVWAVGRLGIVYRTVNGGATWVKIAGPGDGLCAENDINRVYAMPDGTVWLSGDQNCLTGTSNGLETDRTKIKWVERGKDLPVQYLDGMGLQFADRFGEANLGWWTGHHFGSSPLGYLYITQDGGKTWSQLPLPDNRGFMNLAFVPNP
jgi:photosystem II stability/assembly factor-like uncharacterized protein